jgi:hypothetical protein
MHDQSFSTRISPSRKEGSMERLKYVGDIIGVVHFATSRESIDHMEVMWVVYDCEHELLALDIGPGFYRHFIFG